MDAGNGEAAAAGDLLHVVGIAGVRLDDRVPVVRLGVNQIAELAVVQHGADGFELGIPAEHAAHDGFDAGLLDRLDDLGGAFGGGAGRLLDDDVPSAQRGPADVLGPRVGVRAVHDDVDVLVVEKRIDRVELLAIHPVRLHQVGGFFGGLVVHADDLGEGVIAKCLHVLPGHPAGADDPYTVTLGHLEPPRAR